MLWVFKALWSLHTGPITPPVGSNTRSLSRGGGPCGVPTGPQNTRETDTALANGSKSLLGPRKAQKNGNDRRFAIFTGFYGNRTWESLK